MKKLCTLTLGLLLAIGCFHAEASAQRGNGQKDNAGAAGQNGRRGPQRGGPPQQGQRQGQQAGQNQGAQGQGGQGRGGGQGQGGGLNAQQVAERMLANFDADGNGELNLTELTNGLTALEQAMRQRQGGQGQGRGGQDQQGGQRQAGGRQGQQGPRGARGGGNDGGETLGANARRQGPGGRGGGQRGGR